MVKGLRANSNRLWIATLLLASLTHAPRVQAATDVIDVDISPLIDRSALYPTRFAVDVPHSVTLTTHGEWQQSGTSSTWTYTARIPTAISMSFHATSVALPPSATLTVSGSHGSVRYRARDINRGGLWARPVLGDAVLLTLSVATAERQALRLDIASFQAGYRALGGAAADNAHYHKLLATSASTSVCTENYSCDATPANQAPAQATVAIVVGNTNQCTGTLLNDTSLDGTPYVLTARHCENGQLGGGEPAAAQTITVYWDAVTPCSGALSNIYDGNAITQSGATTVVEQQDAWLVKLDAAPAATDAFAAGWDATGGTFSGGYSIHHALGYDKQYVSWYGQPIVQSIPGTTLKIGYTSDFLGVVNQLGSVGAGASGSALFDPANHAVGSASLAALVQGANSAGVCPASPLAAPTSSNITAQFTALAPLWSSTADATSSTGGTTLQAVLDPAKSGKLVLDGVAIVPVTLTSSAAQDAEVFTGDAVTLTWSAPGFTSCIAGGGVAGDGWTGTQAATGSLQLTEQAAAVVTYSLYCSSPGKIGTASVSVNWVFVAAIVNFEAPTSPVYAGSTFPLQWAANTTPCTATGGLSGDGWAGSKPASGSQSIAATTLGTVTYSLTCGSGGRVATAQSTVSVVGPTISPVTTDATQLRIGQPANLSWTGGGSCTASGGAPGDGWAGSTFVSTSGGVRSFIQAVTENTAGTYTYTITCAGAGQSVTASVAVAFVNSPPTVTLTASASQAEIYTDTGSTGLVTLNFTSNVRPCAISFTGPGTIAGSINVLTGVFPAGSGIDSQAVAGNYRYTLTCGSGTTQAQATATVTWFTTQPTVTMNLNNPWPQGFPDVVQWTSNVYPCTGTSGGNGDGWAGPKAAAAGQQNLTENVLGSLTFGITCGTGTQIVQAQASTTVIVPTASIAATPMSPAINQVLSITWNANFAPCTGTVSPGTSVWGTILNTSGTFNTSQSVPGTYTYTISCAGAQASVQVVVTGTAQPATLSAGSATAPVNTPVSLNWNSATGSTCTASGGVAGDGWTGVRPNSGSQEVTSPNAVAVTYSISCSNLAGQTQAQATVSYTAVAATAPAPLTPQVTLTSSVGTATVGNSITLTWTSENASQCIASGGASGDGWNGSLPLSGTQTVTESSAGSVSYDITCTGAPPAAEAHVLVIFATASSTGGSSGGGKSGGGGAMGMPFLCMLGLLVWSKRRSQGTRGQLFTYPIEPSRVLFW